MRIHTYTLLLFATTILCGCRTAGVKFDFLPVKDGTAHLSSWGGGIVLDIPDEYEVVRSKSCDFDVFTICNTKDSNCWLGVYIGHHPMNNHIDGQDILKIPIVVNAKHYNWIRTVELPPAESRIYRHDLYIKKLFDNHDQESAQNVIVHVWTRGTITSFDEVKGIAETIRLAPKSEATENNTCVD